MYENSETTLARCNHLVILLKTLIQLLFMLLSGVVQLVCGLMLFLVQRALHEILATEEVFLMMNNLYAFTSQFFFFTLCDLTLLNSNQSNNSNITPTTSTTSASNTTEPTTSASQHTRGKIISSLTTLLLYSIFTYFASKIKETFSQSFERVRIVSSTRDNFITVVKVILEFAKATIVVLCLREQGLQYHFDAIYSPITFVYYVCSEKLLVDTLISCARILNYTRFDGLEHLYVPILLHIIAITLSFVTIASIFSGGENTMYTFMSSYFTLYLPMKDLALNYINPLLLEQRTFASFKIASEKDLTQWDDICAVCLEKMSRARITPCNHLFHPQCLKRCLQSSMQCPLCKSNFIPN